MKIVIDTNIVLSALFSNKGASNKLLVWLFENKKKYNVVSNTLVTEFEDVLTREKNLKQFNNLQKEDVLAFIDDICLISYHQSIHFLWRPFLTDSNDDMVLEVAVNANAGAIITFNPKDFKGVKESFGIDIFTPKEYLTNIGVI
ncbi:MAG: putative toxin-antitoxin system toxin component, PIN family [Epsilonproteobacteria bacterium]|nr:putative toxin-antitoxin system toxin component, PIN family [Campylobacterota bacterium]